MLGGVAVRDVESMPRVRILFVAGRAGVRTVAPLTVLHLQASPPVQTRDNPYEHVEAGPENAAHELLRGDQEAPDINLTKQIIKQTNVNCLHDSETRALADPTQTST